MGCKRKKACPKSVSCDIAHIPFIGTIQQNSDHAQIDHACFLQQDYYDVRSSSKYPKKRIPSLMFIEVITK